MSNKNRKNAALAALGCGLTFVFGFALLVTQLMPYIELQFNPEQAVEFVILNHTLISVWNFIIYILFGVLLAVLVIELHRELSPVDPFLSHLAAVFGIVWITLVIGSGMLANHGLSSVVHMASEQPAMAQSLWVSIMTIKEGLGGSNEIVGGIWVLLVSITIWKKHVFTPVLPVIGVVAGFAGILSTAPPLSSLGAVFGLLLIVWFLGLSLVMMRGSAFMKEGQQC